MSKSLDPQHVSGTDWYYEEDASMLVVHEVRDEVLNVGDDVASVTA